MKNHILSLIVGMVMLVGSGTASAEIPLVFTKPIEAAVSQTCMTIMTQYTVIVNAVSFGVTKEALLEGVNRQDLQQFERDIFIMAINDVFEHGQYWETADHVAIFFDAMHHDCVNRLRGTPK